MGDAVTVATRVARADVVGSLLRPAYLKDARQGARAGTVGDVELRAAEDRAVREAIALQEAAGLDVITDGELRRNSWVVTIPLRQEGGRTRRWPATSSCRPTPAGGPCGRSRTAGAPRSRPPRRGRS